MKTSLELSTEVLASDLQKRFFPGNSHDGQVGFELELWPFRHTKDDPAARIPLFSEHGNGLVQMLEQLSKKANWLVYAPKPDGLPHFTTEGGGNLTFEPGGQLEYSGPPKPNLAEAITDITNFIELMRCGLKPHDVWFFHSGLNPWHTLEEIPLQLDHPRYRNMNNYFQAIGPYGQRMMRQSTSLQVNLDNGDNETAQRRWLAANLLAPIFVALFGNSPFVDGKPTGAYSFRSLIWQRLDPSRTGMPKGMMAEDYRPCPVEQYLDFALDANVMRLPTATGETAFEGEFKSFRQWLTQGINGFFPDKADWDLHLSTLFPDVRVRGFLEVRFLDAQSKVWCSVPGILLTHLIYSEQAREEVIAMLEPYRTTLEGMMEVAAIKGMDEPEIASVAKKVFQLGLGRTNRDEEDCVLELCERFYRMYTHESSNPAAQLVRLADGNVFTPKQYRDFEAAQVQEAGSLLQTICDYS